MAEQFWDGTDGSGYVAEDFGDRSSWDVVYIGGMALPGLSRATARPRRRVQQKKSNGNDGATPTFRGYEPADVSVDWIIWTPDQFAEYKRIIRIIWPGANQAAIALTAVSFGPVAPVGAAINNALNLTPFDITYPSLQPLGIKSVIVRSLSALERDGTKGAMRCQLDCVEYAEVKPTKTAVKTANGSAKAIPLRKSFQPVPKGANTPVPPSQSGSGKPPKSALTGGGG